VGRYSLHLRSPDANCGRRSISKAVPLRLWDMREVSGEVEIPKARAGWSLSRTQDVAFTATRPRSAVGREPEAAEAGLR